MKVVRVGRGKIWCVGEHGGGLRRSQERTRYYPWFVVSLIDFLEVGKEMGLTSQQGWWFGY
jgi:hypothetical protein